MKKYAYIDTTTSRIGVADLHEDGRLIDSDGPSPVEVSKPPQMVEFDFEVDLPIVDAINKQVRPAETPSSWAWTEWLRQREEPKRLKDEQRATEKEAFDKAGQRFQDILAAPERLTRELKLARQAVRESRETLKSQKAAKAAFDKEQKAKKGEDVGSESTRQRRQLVVNLALASSNDDLDAVVRLAALIPSTVEAERAIAKVAGPAPIETPVVQETLVSDAQKKVAELEIQLLDARSAAKLAQHAQKTFSNQTDAFRMQKIDSGWRPRL
jgi:hypothetical protein